MVSPAFSEAILSRDVTLFSWMFLMTNFIFLVCNEFVVNMQYVLKYYLSNLSLGLNEVHFISIALVRGAFFSDNLKIKMSKSVKKQ